MATFSVTKMIGTGVCAALLALAPCEHEARAADPAPVVVLPMGGAAYQLAPTVAIGCATSGGGQEVAKTPVLKNTSLVTLMKGTTVSWTSSDGDSGKVVLAEPLAVGATLKTQGSKPGNNYACKATFQARPDLRVKRVFSPGAMQATVEIENADPYADAAPSKIRLDVAVCNSSLKQTLESAPIAIGKGQTKAITFTHSPMFGKIHYVAWADIGKSVTERMEQNNHWQNGHVCMSP